MLKEITRKPAEGMCFDSLEDQNEVSAVSKRFLLASIRELIEDLDSVKSKFENLDYEECGVAMHKERRYVAHCVDEAAEYMSRFLGDIDDDWFDHSEDGLDV
ncbi:hypothetical protein ACN3VN_05515 [Xylella fastidiosa]|uniref:hypothetical protein n=1 Tax=Xylella fastidiosa TaxID=2371 RepID=UPI0007334E9C|nr:hypothetical protein [Xylella fastidiosa]